MVDKHTLRQRFRRMRRQIPLMERKAQNRALVKLLTTLDSLKNAHVIASFRAIRSEIELTSLCDSLAHVRFVFPRCEGNELRFCEAVPTCREDWSEGVFGIQEPVSEPIATSAIDWILVPALACDIRGIRLGYGGGFYDRFLAQNDALKTRSTVVLYREQLVLELPDEHYDVAVASVATADGLWPARHPQLTQNAARVGDTRPLDPRLNT